MYVDGVFDNGNGGVVSGDGTITANDYTGGGTTFGYIPTSSITDSTTVTSNPLPIELVDFSLININNYILISWITSTEINNNFFTIEKTLNLLDYEVVGYVNGAGNSNQINNYTYIDSNPYLGISYYRLKQTDFDGKYKYFTLKSINMIINRSFDLFPNPAKSCNEITLSFTNFEEPVLVVVNDIYGQELFTKIYITQQNGFVVGMDCMNNLSPGTYIIVATSKNQIYKKKLVIQ